MNNSHLVVYEELRGHHDEAEHVHEPNQRVEHPAVPAAMLLVEQRVRGIPDHKRRDQVQQVRRGDVVELLRLALDVGGEVTRRGFSVFARVFFVGRSRFVGAYSTTTTFVSEEAKTFRASC